jgi:hypothetical protein
MPTIDRNGVTAEPMNSGLVSNDTRYLSITLEGTFARDTLSLTAV